MSRRVDRGSFRRSCRTCGWSRVYDTARKADYAKRRHSCERAQRRAESSSRNQARMAAVDRTPKPCLHKYADHEHGTYSCYTLDRCRCAPCAAAQAVYETDRIRQQAYGRWDNLVDAGPVRDHVNALRAQGMGFKRIGEIAGVSNGAMTKLLYGHYAPGPGGRNGRGELLRGPAKRVRKETASKLLAVTLELRGGRLVDATGSIRRVRALVALGWSQSQIAQRLGIKQRRNFHLGVGRRTYVTHTTAEAVKALYEELSMQLPPADTWHRKTAVTRSRNHARERGWLPPLALEDERIDDPDYRPESITPDVDTEIDDVAVQRRLDGDRSVRLTAAERNEVLRLALDLGLSKREIERTTGINPYRKAS